MSLTIRCVWFQFSLANLLLETAFVSVSCLSGYLLLFLHILHLSQYHDYVYNLRLTHPYILLMFIGLLSSYHCTFSVERCPVREI